MNISGTMAEIKIQGPAIIFKMSDGERLIIYDRGGEPVARKASGDNDPEGFLGATITEISAGERYEWNGDEDTLEAQDVIVATDKGKLVLIFEHEIHLACEQGMSIWLEYKDEEELIA